METICIGILASRVGKVGKELVWDADKLRFTNDDDANTLTGRKLRKEFISWE